MKKQITSSNRKNIKFTALAAIVLMLAALICCFAIPASAAPTQKPAITVDVTELGFTMENGKPTKTYDGQSQVIVTIEGKAEHGVIDGDQVTITATVTFADVNVGETSITVDYALSGANAADYQEPSNESKGVVIKPIELTWNGVGTASALYNTGKTSYENLEVTLPGVKLPDGSDASLTPVSVGKANISTDKAGVYDTDIVVDFGANYTIGRLPVKVTVSKIQITAVEWSQSNFSFTWGSVDTSKIRVDGKDADGNVYEMKVQFPGDYTGDVGTYTLTAVLSDAVNFEIAPNVDCKKNMAITQKIYMVNMDNATYISNSQVSADPGLYNITVGGDDIPANVLATISYYVNGQKFTGTAISGVYNITAVLTRTSNYKFVNTNGEDVNTLSATLIINKQFVFAGTDDAPYQVIMVGENGIGGENTSLTVTIPEKLNRKAIQKFNVYRAYTVAITGEENGTFTLMIPISDVFYAKNNAALDVNSLYIYEDATGKIVPVAGQNGYQVTMKDGYYEIKGVDANSTLTFVIAPEYDVPFFASAPGIVLIILLVIALLVLMFFVGLYHRRVLAIANSEENPVLTMDDEGDIPEIVEPIIPDKVDMDEAIDGMLEDAEAAAAAVETEEGVSEEVEAATAEAVAESLDELAAEASEIDLHAPVEVAELDQMADTMAEELAESVTAEEAEAEADADALQAAVAEAMAENFNESADDTDAVAIIVGDETEEVVFDNFRDVVDAIVCDAIMHTVEMPAEEAVEEAAEEVVEEATEEVVEEAAEEAVEEATEEVVEEAAEEVVEEAAEEVVEEAAEEVVEEAAEEVVEEAAEEVVEETAEEAAEEECDVCAVVATSVAEAFENLAADGIEAKAVEGTTKDTITEAVDNAAEANIPEDWTEELANEVKAAVVDELAARLLVEEPAVETMAEVDEDNDDDDDDDEDEGNFSAFGNMPQSFIDAIENAAEYSEMLEQEARGEVILVTRYRRSFLSRMSQSGGNVQEYYNAIKNLLLSYKGVKSRTSWNYDAFNRGRTHVAKVIAKSKTLYLYLALDPAELADTKYGIVDVSSKKKYASVPVLMKIKGDRKFKYAMELVEKLCGEVLALQQKPGDEVDYRVPYQTTEELVQAGLVKKLVAAIPVANVTSNNVEEAPETAEEANENATPDITFVEPTDAPAVEEAIEAEEAAEAAEAPAEEVAAEEVPAEADNSEEPKEV